MSWPQIILFVVSLVISYATRPRPPSAPRPAGLDDIQVPTAEAGREIPVLFGTREIKSPNVVWYGDLSTIAVRKRSSKK